MYFSDVYCTQRVPQQLRKDPVLWGECLSGALYWNDFLRLARECGFTDPRQVSSHPITIGNPAVQEAVDRHMPNSNSNGGSSLFYSATYRLFKIAHLEPDCEDYGQAVQYLGNMPAPMPMPRLHVPVPLPIPLATSMAVTEGGNSATSSASSSNNGSVENAAEAVTVEVETAAEGGTIHTTTAPLPSPPQQRQQKAAPMLPSFDLDGHHHFPAGKVMPVCGNTFRMLHQTRFRPHFNFYGGDFAQHFGIFEGCGKNMPFATTSSSSSSSSSSCAGGSCC